MRRRWFAVGVAIALSIVAPVRLGTSPAHAEPSSAPGSYAWPVVGPVIRGFIPPPNPYASGHRGIDIATPFGTPLHAAQDGTVAFAGRVAGALYTSIDHLDGIRSTYSWLSEISVTKGQRVTKEAVIGRTGHGHPDVAEPHLHFGARIGNTYIDPMSLLEPGNVAGFIRLAPLEGPVDGAFGLRADLWSLSLARWYQRPASTMVRRAIAYLPPTMAGLWRPGLELGIHWRAGALPVARAVARPGRAPPALPSS